MGDAVTEVRAICHPTLASGFHLAGVPVDTAADRDAATALLDAMPADVGLVLVQDALHDPSRRARGLPVVLPFPGPALEARADDRVVEILRRAIGYRVRLT